METGADTGPKRVDVEVEVGFSRIQISGEGEDDRTIELGDYATIGRSSKSDIVIDQLDCSRTHAELRLRGDGRYELVDLGSRNGCFVNGVRMEGSRVLADGDRIDIAEVVLRFGQDDAPRTSRVGQSEPFDLAATTGVSAASKAQELPAVVLAADVAGYAQLAARLAPAPLREFVGAWVEDARRLIERRRGTFDRMADKTLIGYWLIDDPASPAPEIGLALEALLGLVGLREDVAPQFSAQFDGVLFRTAIGLHMGAVQLGNAGATQEQVWSVAGGAVCAAVALECMAEEQDRPAIVSAAVAAHAPGALSFTALGPSPLSENGQPIEALALARP